MGRLKERSPACPKTSACPTVQVVEIVENRFVPESKTLIGKVVGLESRLAGMVTLSSL